MLKGSEQQSNKRADELHVLEPDPSLYTDNQLQQDPVRGSERVHRTESSANHVRITYRLSLPKNRLRVRSSFNT